MAEKSGKKKTKKATKASAETSVLGNLRSTRPTRLGGDRRASATRSSGAEKTAPRAAAAKTAAATKPAAAPKSSRPAAEKPKAKAAKPKAKASKPKVRTNAGTQPRPAPAPPAGWQTPGEDDRKGGATRGPEIVSTAVQAAGEIAQLGITVGGQLLKRAAGRIPRP